MITIYKSKIKKNTITFNYNDDFERFSLRNTPSNITEILKNAFTVKKTMLQKGSSVEESESTEILIISITSEEFRLLLDEISKYTSELMEKTANSSLLYQHEKDSELDSFREALELKAFLSALFSHRTKKQYKEYCYFLSKEELQSFFETEIIAPTTQKNTQTSVLESANINLVVHQGGKNDVVSGRKGLAKPSPLTTPSKTFVQLGIDFKYPRAFKT